MDGSASYPVRHANLDLTSAATVTSTRFEVAIERFVLPAAGKPLFWDNTIRIALDDLAGTDVIPDGTGGAAYVIDWSLAPPLPVLSLARQDKTHLRVLTYNVLSDGIFKTSRKGYFEGLLRAIRPEIIGFEEIYNHSAGETALVVEQMLPSSGGEQWYGAKVHPDVIAVSRYPITDVFAVDGNGAFLMDLRPEYDKDLLLVVAHLPCCDNDAQRQLEIDALMAFIRNAKGSGGVLDLVPDTPILIVGDMNLVGRRQQQKTLLTGDIVNSGLYGSSFSPDWDGSDFDDALPRHTELPMTFTWHDDASTYWPGRLDYIVYSGSVMDIGNRFVLFTPWMSQDTLDAHGLQGWDTIKASDHLPVVADFALSVPVAAPHIIERVHPIPSRRPRIVFTELAAESRKVLSFYDVDGRKVYRAELSPGQAFFDWEALNDSGHTLASGVYFMIVKVGHREETTKLVITR